MLLKKILWKENAFTIFAIAWLILIIWVCGKEVDQPEKRNEYFLVWLDIGIG